MCVTELAGASGWAKFFWAAFERSANPMSLLTPDRVIVAVNKAFEKASGYAADEIGGRRADFLVAPEYWKRIEADWVELKRRGRICGSRELVTASGDRLRIQFALQQEVVTGRGLVLFVVLEEQFRPMTRPDGSEEPAGKLSPRELEVVREIAMGRRAHEIGAELFISTSTVQSHVRNAMKKVGARSQAQLVAIAIATGVLDPRGLGDARQPSPV